MYFVQFEPGGTVDYVSGSLRDAKEFDPKYSQTIKEVQEEAGQAVTRGRGSVYSVWSIMQNRLKSKGIDWHSPAELNPNARFD